MSAELRFCPFCGSEWVEIRPKPHGYAVHCRECMAAGPYSEQSEADAIEQWNDRHGDACPECGGDGSLEKPYPSDCPQHHAGKAMLRQAQRRQARRRR